MSILEKEVWVKCGVTTDKYFEDLGYNIPRYTDKYGKTKVRKGTKILVRIGDIPDGSNIKVTKICDDCGKYTPNQNYSLILRRRKEFGKDRCFDCGGIYKGLSRKNNIPYERSLELFAIENKKGYLLKEFNLSMNVKTPKDISFGSKKEYWWHCEKCNGDYKMKVSSKTGTIEAKCPYCAGARVLIGFNDLWTTHPHIAEILLVSENGYEITAGCNRKEDFKCNNCGYVVHNKVINNIVNRGFRCSRCSDGISYPEKFVMNLLNQLNVDFETQKKFDWSLNKKYDFYIPNLKVIIEVHGDQHYSGKFESIGGRDLKAEKENDSLKEIIAIKNGIKYIVIDARISDLKWIKTKIIESELLNLFDLSVINWLKCHEFACNSLVKETCELWKGGMINTIEISKRMNITHKTVTVYLKQGKELGWCDYDPKEELKKNGRKNGVLNGGKVKKVIVIQLTKENKFINEFPSATMAGELLKINLSNIIQVCKGNKRYAGGYKWMYKEDYNKLI